MATKVLRLEDEVQIFRDFRHNEYNNRITQIQLDMRTDQKMIESAKYEVDALREWRHTVVDPYVPRVLDVFNERLGRLERKVFNGHRGEER